MAHGAVFAEHHLSATREAPCGFFSRPLASRTALAGTGGLAPALLRPRARAAAGGLFLNGDHMAFGAALPTFARLSQQARDEQWTDDAFAVRGIETAEQWWDALTSDPAFAPLLTNRAERFAGKTRQQSPPGFDVRVEALREAGFREWRRSGRCSRVASCWPCASRTPGEREPLRRLSRAVTYSAPRPMAVAPRSVRT